MAQNQVRIELEFDETSGKLRGAFINDSDRDFELRYMYDALDLKIQINPSIRARFHSKDLCGVDIPLFILPAFGRKDDLEYDLFEEFIYPEAGHYHIWVDYDSWKLPSRRCVRPQDWIRLKSNLLKIYIPEATKIERVQIDEEKYWKAVARMNRPWWKFW